MTVRTRAQLNSDADTNINDNTSGDVSPADVRQRVKDLADSATLAEDIGVTVQPYDADLASWAGVTRASGFDTFAATPSSANLRALLTDETGTGAAVFGTSPTFTTDITVPNTGLHILDTDASHDLILAPGSNLTADRTLTLTTGDSNRTLDISANSFISQDYRSSATPTFAGINLSNSDTTLARVSAGVISVEGVNVILGALGSTDNVLLRSDGTGGVTAQGSAIAVDDSGNMSGVGTLAAGATTLSGLLTTNGQIKFPATQNPSADANTMDDYEVGTYTPTWTGDTTNPVLGNGTIAASYAKAGDMVSVGVRVDMGSTTTFGSGGWRFTLPFTATDANPVGPAIAFDNGTAFRIGMNALVSTTQMGAYSDNSGTRWGATLPFTWTNLDYLRIGVVYTAA